MRIPEGLKRLRKLLGWPMLIVGGLLSITGNILDIREISSVGFPISVWQLIGFVLIFLAIVSILYQFQSQLDSVSVAKQVSVLPKKPKYNSERKKEAMEFLVSSIREAEKLKARIQPTATTSLGNIQYEISELNNKVERRIGEIMPEYCDYIYSVPHNLDVQRYNLWHVDAAEESKKLDRLLFKLKKIRSQL